MRTSDVYQCIDGVDDAIDVSDVAVADCTKGSIGCCCGRFNYVVIEMNE